MRKCVVCTPWIVSGPRSFTLPLSVPASIRTRYVGLTGFTRLTLVSRFLSLRPTLEKSRRDHERNPNWLSDSAADVGRLRYITGPTNPPPPTPPPPPPPPPPHP